MTHWLDRVALRTAARIPRARALPPAPASLAPRPPRHALVGKGATELTAVQPGDRPFSRLVGLRMLAGAAGLVGLAPLIRPTGATATSLLDCEPGCLADAEDLYRRRSIYCNSGLPDPIDLLGASWWVNPLCQATSYQQLVTTRRHCVTLVDCGRKQPPPPAPPPQTRPATSAARGLRIHRADELWWNLLSRRLALWRRGLHSPSTR